VKDLWKSPFMDLKKKEERKLIMAMWLKIETAVQLLVKPSISDSC